MRVGVQFQGHLPARATRRWFTHSWPADWHVAWHAVPLSLNGGRQLHWDVAVQRTANNRLTYWITVQNLTSHPVRFEGRYAVMN